MCTDLMPGGDALGTNTPTVEPRGVERPRSPSPAALLDEFVCLDCSYAPKRIKSE